MFNSENLKKYAIGTIVSIIFLVVFIIYNSSSKGSNAEVLSLNESIHIEEDEVAFKNYELFEDIPSESIFVEIKGEVLNPDVYELQQGSIVKDLIDISGGLTEYGDTSNINQARQLQNGECVVISSEQEILSVKYNQDFYGVSSGNFSGNDSLININTASRDELKTLNGIGDGLADLIIEYREENGLFKNIEDIKNVSRIGDKTFEKFKDKIKV